MRNSGGLPARLRADAAGRRRDVVNEIIYAAATARPRAATA
jgi:hypothetical protein